MSVSPFNLSKTSLISYTHRNVKVFTANSQNKSLGFWRQQKYLFSRIYILLVLKLWKLIFLRNDHTTCVSCFDFNSKFLLFANFFLNVQSFCHSLSPSALCFPAHIWFSCFSCHHYLISPHLCLDFVPGVSSHVPLQIVCSAPCLLWIIVNVWSSVSVCTCLRHRRVSVIKYSKEVPRLLVPCFLVLPCNLLDAIVTHLKIN